MDNTSSTISALYLLPDWKRRILEDDASEASELEGAVNNGRLTRPLRGIGRRGVWNMGQLLGVNVDGVPGQACRLLEKYLARQLQSAHALDMEQWDQLKEQLLRRTPLLITSCLQLAAKMSCAGANVTPSMVRYRLLSRGVVVSIEDIITTEYHVFSTLGFCVPLWTSVDVAQLLATEVGIPRSLMRFVELLMDLTERHRDRLNAHMQNLAGFSLDTNGLHKASVRTLHLCAGVVEATSKRCLDDQDQELKLVQLSKLTRAPVSFISCLCNVILSHILVIQDDCPRPCKRKMSESPVY